MGDDLYEALEMLEICRQDTFEINIIMTKLRKLMKRAAYSSHLDDDTIVEILGEYSCFGT